MCNFVKFAAVAGMIAIATAADAETPQERFERAQKTLIDSGTSKDHINSITLVAQLIARDKVCPPDDNVTAYRAWETGMQAEQTGLSKEVLISKAQAFVPIYVDALNSDPSGKAQACMP